MKETSKIKYIDVAKIASRTHQNTRYHGFGAIKNLHI